MHAYLQYNPWTTEIILKNIFTRIQTPLTELHVVGQPGIHVKGL